MAIFILPYFIINLIYILARKGVLKSLIIGKLNHNDGKKLAACFEYLGPSFIKLGQALSVRPDLVGDHIAQDLARLQDQVPPAPFHKVKKHIEYAINGHIDDVFDVFDDNAIAAASIAQVYKAKLKKPINSQFQSDVVKKNKEHDGWVAVKVLRPNIEKKFSRDLILFRILAYLLLFFIPKSQRLRPLQIVETMQQWTENELDLRLEAAAAFELSKNFADESNFNIPMIDWRYSSRHVMISEWIDGIRIDDANALINAGYDLDTLLEKCATFFLFQIFRDGFFHADIHPGNILITKDGNLTALDFGIMGRIKPHRRLFLAELLLGFLYRDYKRIAEIHYEHGITPYDQPLGKFTQSLCAIGEPLMNLPPEDISIGRLLSQMFEVTEEFNMPLQTDLLLLQKTILMAEGIGKMLNPHVNMWLLCQYILEDWMIANHGPEAKLLQLGKKLLSHIDHYLNDYYTQNIQDNDIISKSQPFLTKKKIIISCCIITVAIIGYYLNIFL